MGGLISDDFKSRHTLLLTHIWMVHRRLMAEGKVEQAEKALSIQECVFDEMWNDTSNRIRAAGINELSVCILESTQIIIRVHPVLPYSPYPSSLNIPH